MATKHKSLIHKLSIRTSRRTELKNITDEIEKVVRESGCANGVCHLYVPHTTAAVMINEGYDPDVAGDMEMAFDRLVPRSGDYRHAEGNSDSHIKTALVGSRDRLDRRCQAPARPLANDLFRRIRRTTAPGVVGENRPRPCVNVASQNATASRTSQRRGAGVESFLTKIPE